MGYPVWYNGIYDKAQRSFNNHSLVIIMKQNGFVRPVGMYVQVYWFPSQTCIAFHKIKTYVEGEIWMLT